MAKVDIKTSAGKSAGSVELDDAVFGIEPNVPVMHQVVTAQLAARRAGTHSTLTRREVRGGGAKPWKQKGTGRARAGSSTVPNWRGGGVAMGPKPRDYSQRTPKKMKRLALRSALSDRAAEGNVIVVDGWEFDRPRTKDAVAALAAIGAAGKVLLVVDRDDEAAWKSFRNLTDVHVVTPGELNTYDILVADVVVFTKDNLPTAGAGEAKKASRSGRSEGRATNGASGAAAEQPEERSDGAATAEEDGEAGSGSAGPAESASGAAAEQPEERSDEAAIAEETAPFGPGSAHPLEDGSAPSDEYTVKGNEGSMLYHTPESPFYGRTNAEVWFTDAAAAEAAGFSLPPSMRDDDAEDAADADATDTGEEEE